jgi:hypothetical protein
VVDSNVTYSQAGSYQTNSADRASLWYTPNCAGGADTVTVTPSANTKVGIAIFEFSGAATSSPLDQTHGAGSTTSSLTTGTVPVNNANELVIAVFCMGTGSQLAGFTATGNITSLGFSNLAGSNAGIATTYNVSQSAGVAATASITGSAPYSGIGASFKPANLPPQRPAMSLTEDLAPLLDPGGIFAQGALWQSQVPPRVVVPQLISVAGGWEEHPLWET